MVNKTSLAIIALTILILALPSACAAQQIYSNEYYELENQSNELFITYTIKDLVEGSGTPSIAVPTGLSAIELRRHTILMERQNELQAELIKAKWVETCYAPKYNGIGTLASPSPFVNQSAWESECANAGYPV